MRLAIVSYSRRKIGGAERNLDVVLPELERRGHMLQFLYLHDAPADREPVRTGPDTELVHITPDRESALARLRAFRPDLINVHGDIGPSFLSAFLPIAPSAYSVHNYYGTCISGLKTRQFPIIQPCESTFGPNCLLAYLPRQCGGRSPFTMFRLYQREGRRREVLTRYDAVVTHSAHMEAEYRRHGFQPDRIHGLPYEISSEQGRESRPHALPLEQSLQLLFIGRMEPLKGGQVLIDALPAVHHSLARPVQLHLAGDGPARARWERLARRITRHFPAITFQFHDWLSEAQLGRRFAETHLLAVPSLWPEPFGKVGPEAAAHGIPVAAFDVGGVREWLSAGVNGMLAPGDPPTAAGLARAIHACVSDSAVYRNLSTNAALSVRRFRLDRHVDALLALFERIVRARNLAAAS